MMPEIRSDVGAYPGRCTKLSSSPNSAFQRAGTHKLLGRGRPASCASEPRRARVLKRWRAAAELGS
jgi:hypothetical protein